MVVTCKQYNFYIVVNIEKLTWFYNFLFNLNLTKSLYFISLFELYNFMRMLIYHQSKHDRIWFFFPHTRGVNYPCGKPLLSFSNGWCFIKNFRSELFLRQPSILQWSIFEDLLLLSKLLYILPKIDIKWVLSKI